MIIVGYQGIGKSTLAAKYLKIIDLESSNFFVDGKRPEDWHKIYCNVAISLHNQGYVVFMSSHKAVRDCLATSGLRDELFIVFPKPDLKDQWIQKLKDRYESTNSDKDFRAWKNAEQCYDENIRDLIVQQGFTKIPIDMDYSLGDIVLALLYQNCE